MYEGIQTTLGGPPSPPRGCGRAGAAALQGEPPDGVTVRWWSPFSSSTLASPQPLLAKEAAPSFLLFCSLTKRQSLLTRPRQGPRAVRLWGASAPVTAHFHCDASHARHLWAAPGRW